MGRSMKDDRPVAGPATGQALKSALKDALAAKGDNLYQTKAPAPAAPTSTPSGDLAAGMSKLLTPTSNVEKGIKAGGA